MHDQLFKSLLERFLGDFVRIVLPDHAPGLRLERATFHRKEYFTRAEGGRRRQLDVVAEVRRAGRRAGSVIVHVEIETQFRSGVMERRMARYAMLLRLHHDKLVVAIVLYVRGGPAGAADVTVEERLDDRRLSTFTYTAFGISRLRATELLERPEALAPALAALARRGDLSRAEQKLRCLRRIARLEIDEAARHLLVNCVETYLQLKGADREEYANLLADEPTQEVQAMQMTYAEKIEAEGVKKGMAQGMERGMEKGMERGMEKGRVEGMRALLRGLLERRFGPLPRTVEERLLAVSSADELSRLHGKALDARSLAELGL